MLELYKNIKARRKQLKITQTELAQALGYSDKSMISRIEKGEIDLPQSKIMAFAKALSISPSDLMGWEDVPTEQDTIAEIVELLKKAPPEEVELIKNLLLNFKGVKGADK